MFKCLAFGLSLAPRVFTKLLKLAMGFLRQIGYCLIIYLDDILILHQNREQLHQNRDQITQYICQLLEGLELMINQKKSMTNSTQELGLPGGLCIYKSVHSLGVTAEDNVRYKANVTLPTGHCEGSNILCQ